MVSDGTETEDSDDSTLALSMPPWRLRRGVSCGSPVGENSFVFLEGSLGCGKDFCVPRLAERKSTGDSGNCLVGSTRLLLHILHLARLLSWVK